MLESLPEWSRAIPYRPQPYLKSHVFIDEKMKFNPSCNKKSSKPSMRLLLSWEYSRIYTKELDAFIKARKKRDEVKHFSNDFSKWMEKRKPKEEFSCRPSGSTTLAPRKQGQRLKSISRMSHSGKQHS